MLSKSQEKIITTLHTKKGRTKHGLCLVEGEKNVTAAAAFVEYTFTPHDTTHFSQLITTQTPQQLAAVARIPQHDTQTVLDAPTILVTDNVQDPGNMGAIIRLCEGFSAALVMIDSCDVTNPKVIRASAGAMFRVPWITLTRAAAQQWLGNTHSPVYRLEKREDSMPLKSVQHTERAVWIAGSEGNGLLLPDDLGVSVHIEQNESLESLNVTHAVALALYSRYTA